MRCSDVLAVIGDYMDGELDPTRRAQVDTHLAGCDWCERFGGSMAGVIGALRRRARDTAPSDLLGRIVGAK